MSVVVGIQLLKENFKTLNPLETRLGSSPLIKHEMDMLFHAGGA